MKYNMNFYDIGIRYLVAYALVLIGFLTQQVGLMVMATPFFFIGLLGICPLFTLLGIDHNNFESHEPKEEVKTPDPASNLNAEDVFIDVRKQAYS